MLTMGTLTTEKPKTVEIEQIEDIQAVVTPTAHINSAYREDGTISRYWVKKEATEIAKVISGIAKNNSDEAQEAIVWLIINRVNGVGFPDTITDVCQQKYQFGTYGTPTEDLVERVYKILMEYYRGGERKYEGFSYCDTDNYKVTLRNTWDENKNTKYTEVR